MPLRKPAKGASKKAKQKAASANISELHRAHPEWPHKRHVAAGMRAAGIARARKARGKRGK